MVTGGILGFVFLKRLVQYFYRTSVVVIDGKACEKNKHHMEPVNVFAQPVKHSWKWPVKKEKKGFTI